MPTLQELLAESRRLEQLASQKTGIAPVLGTQGTPLTSQQSQSIITSKDLSSTLQTPFVTSASQIDPTLAAFNQTMVPSNVRQWNLSQWKTTGTGQFSQVPTLTIDGRTQTFSDVQSAIVALEALKSRGASNTALIDKFISEFQAASPEFTKITPQTTTPTTLITPTTPPTPTTGFGTPKVTPTVTPPTRTSVKDLLNIYQDFLSKQQLGPSEKQASDLTQQIIEAQNALLGKSAFEVGKQKEFGIVEAQEAIDNYMLRLRELERKEAQIRTEYEGAAAAQKGVLEPFVTGERDARLRQNAVEALTVAALLDAAQLRLDFADRKVKQAVKEKYGPLIELQDVKIANLDILKKSGALDRDEEKRADARRFVEFSLKLQLEEEQKEQEVIWKVATEYTSAAVQNGTFDQRTADSILNAGSKEEALQLAAPFLKEGKVLSVLDAQRLGVPFGTTEEEAFGITPSISQEFGLVDSIIANPQLFETLTPSVKTALIPSLTQAGFKFPRKLSAEQDKAQANATSALLAISQMESQLFNPDGSVNRKALIAATSGLGSLAFQRREAIDVLTRIRTGAALNESEQKFYAKQGPRIWDDKNTIEQKLTQLKALYSGIAGTSLTLQSPDGKTYVYEDMFNPEARTEVRRAISNGYKIIQF